MLTPAERKLAAKLLHLAADQFSNHGCNDFQLRKEGGLTDEEARTVVADLNATMHDLDARELDVEYVEDWVFMRYLAKKLEKE